MAVLNYAQVGGTRYDFADGANVAPAFSSSTAYAVGDYVINPSDGLLYQFTTAHAAGAWDSSHVTRAIIGESVSDLKSAATNAGIYNETLDLSDYTIVNGIIVANGYWESYDTTEAKTALVTDIPETVTVKTKSSHGSSIAFLKSVPSQPITYALADFCATETGRHLIDADSEETFTVPYDCVCIAIRTQLNNSTGYGPQSVTCFFNATKVDNSLTRANAPADAKETGDRIDDLQKPMQYFLQTNGTTLYLAKNQWGAELTDYSGKGFVLTGALGTNISNINTIAISILRSYRIDVSGCNKVALPVYKSTSNCGDLFTDAAGIICGAYNNASLDSGTIVTIDVPANAKYLYFSINVNWSGDIKFVVCGNSTIPQGGRIIVHDDSYPSLTAAEKTAIVTLCNAYYAKKSAFAYGGAYRNQYSDQSCIGANQKFLVNCGNFAQMVWMGRSANDFDADSYTQYINKAFDWGYYFDFLVHKKCYGVYKDASAVDSSAKYYGYQHPTGSNEFAFNFYNNGSGMTARPFMAAADMAWELYNMGCEIPRRAVEVGDLIFYRGPEYSGMTNETQLNFRNISHVAIVIDDDYNDLGILRVMESTFYDPAGAISISSLDESNVGNMIRAGMYENRIVMCARHPHAFGIATNVPNAITSI